MLGHTSGTRSASVCHWRCADQCATEHPVRSSSPVFKQVVEASLSRRAVLRGGVSAVVVGGAAQLLGAGPALAAGDQIPKGAAPGHLRFQPIDPVPAGVDAMAVPNGYTWTAIMAWGDPVEPGAPTFDLTAQTPAKQRKQFGYNNDYVTFLPLRNENEALMVVNHEYTNPDLMFVGEPANAGEAKERLRIEMAAHGMSVVKVRRRSPDEPWKPARRSRFNRRVHTHTDLRMVGPAAGSRFLRTDLDPSGRIVQGTLNNCAGGETPWGTVLSGEENFQGYFKNGEGVDSRNASLGVGEGRGWEAVDERFDLSQHPNEINRFGWIVEIDPRRPNQPPRKLTALGRFKHEGATVSIAPDRRVVAVMGDDERFEYMYKFISKRRYRRGSSDAAHDHNRRLLEEGDLYVAKFTSNLDPSKDYDGRGRWLPLVVDGTSKVPGFTVDEVLVFTRAAADKVHPTPMDRPEDVQRNPVNGRIYAALTNNTERTDADPANPRTNNKSGHVVEIREDDPTDLKFTWKLLLVCGRPDDPSTYFAGYPKQKVSPISCPDNVAFDRAGNLWISTDGQDTIGLNDALHLVPVEGPERGHVQQFLAVPAGAETCGPVIDDASKSVFVAVQHPGDVEGATARNAASNFPYGRTHYRASHVRTTPRPAVVQVYRR